MIPVQRLVGLVLECIRNLADPLGVRAGNGTALGFGLILPALPSQEGSSPYEAQGVPVFRVGRSRERIATCDNSQAAIFS